LSAQSRSSLRRNPDEPVLAWESTWLLSVHLLGLLVWFKGDCSAIKDLPVFNKAGADVIPRLIIENWQEDISSLRAKTCTDAIAEAGPVGYDRGAVEDGGHEASDGSGKLHGR
jgi:hypothetical protein